MLNQYILLQGNIFQFGPRSGLTDTIAIIILFIIIGAFFLIGTIYNKRSHNKKTRKKYNKFVARRTAANIGLEPSHIALMDKLVKSLKISHPVLLYSNRTMLENFLRNGIELIEKQADKTDDEKAQYIKYIYEIKETIDMHAKKSIGLKSTHLIKPDQDFMVITQTGEKFRSKVINNLSAMLICSRPAHLKNRPVDLKRGMKVKVIFWRENDSGYSFISRIAGFDAKGVYNNFYIRHANKLLKEQQRKHHRKPIKVSCFIYPAEIIGQLKKKKTPNLNIHYDIRFMGVIKDISARGCRVAVKHAFTMDQLIKLDFSINRKDNISVLGKVRNIHIISGQGINMSVVFKQISNRAKNQIYSFIFNYA